jgi:excisionase family DNA binding protein
MPTPTKPWLTPRDIAEQLGVKLLNVLAWIRSGELVACDLSRDRRVKPRWRIEQAELRAFLLRRQSQPPAPRAQRRKRLESVPEYVK